MNWLRRLTERLLPPAPLPPKHRKVIQRADDLLERAEKVIRLDSYRRVRLPR
jgi:hypothetical protein